MNLGDSLFGFTSRYNLLHAIENARPRTLMGRVTHVEGLTIRAELMGARVGDAVVIHDLAYEHQLPAEVVGLSGQQVILSPFGPTSGVGAGMLVSPIGGGAEVAVGPRLRGCILDGLGNVIHPLPAPELKERVAIQSGPPSPLSRSPIDTPMVTGIRAIDGLMTIGIGQRIGVFGGPGCGKSTLLAHLADHAEADVVVVGLIGERGREVSEFIERHLRDGELDERLIVVAATSDRPPMERVRSAEIATATAEYFRDQGLHVLLIIDSLTRYARALREVGLAAGEPAIRRGYTPSLYTRLPQLFERAGPGAAGSISAVYSILVEGDAQLDPVVEEAISLLDGHVMLDAKLAQKGHFPAIDVLASRSRLTEILVDADSRANARKVRGLIAKRRELDFLLQVGEFRQGQDMEADQAVERDTDITRFLQQGPAEAVSLEETMAQLAELVS